MVRACAPALKKARGAMVNVSSVAAVLGTGSSVAYAASKAALETMSLSLARALAPEVRVNVVAPGHTEHAVASERRRRRRRRRRDLEQRIARSRRSRPSASRRTWPTPIAWLIEGARSVTGETIYVDGGMPSLRPAN